MNARRIGSAGLLIVLLVLIGLAVRLSFSQAGLEFGTEVTPTAIQVDDLAQRVDPAALAAAPIVTVEELLAAPGVFRDQLVQVQGINYGIFESPACSPWFGPPTAWLLASERAVDQGVNSPPRVEIEHFDDAISDRSDACGQTVQISQGKRTALWGWLRLYEGLYGCGGFTLIDGTKVPQPSGSTQAWYFEAVQLQFLENIDVAPRRECTPPTRPPTIERPTDTPRPTSTPAPTWTPAVWPAPTS